MIHFNRPDAHHSMNFGQCLSSDKTRSLGLNGLTLSILHHHHACVPLKNSYEVIREDNPAAGTPFHGTTPGTHHTEARMPQECSRVSPGVRSAEQADD